MTKRSAVFAVVWLMFTLTAAGLAISFSLAGQP